MKKYFITFILLTAIQVPADLLDRVNLEEAFRSRIKEVVQVFDPQAQVLTQFSYQSYQGKLPGTDLMDSTEVIPSNIEVSDLRSVGIKIYSAKAELPSDVQNLIRSALPIPQAKISIQISELKSLPAIPTGMTAEKIENLMLQSVKQVSQSLWILFGSGFMVILAGLFFHGILQQRKVTKSVDRMVQALGDLNLSGSNAAATLTLPSAAAPLQERTSPALLENSWSSFEQVSLVAMISDCYWAEEDGYAAWVWSRFNHEQKKSLLESLAFMSDYSHFLSDIKPVAYPYSTHAYYLNPAPCHSTSQKDLCQMVRENGVVWHSLSPLRQATLPLRLEEKMRFSTLSGDRQQQWNFPVSQLRPLNVSSHWGELTIEDEIELQKNPAAVPQHLRSQIKSLVWLSLLPETEIKEKLEKLDARTLATAWVGPESILVQLEGYLPEKKRDLIREYKNRIPARRDSPAFNWLCEESLKNVAS